MGISSYPLDLLTQHHAEACRRGRRAFPEAPTYEHVPKIPPALPVSMALSLQAVHYFPKITDTHPIVEFLVISSLMGWFISIELGKHIGEKKPVTDIQMFFCGILITRLALNGNCYNSALPIELIAAVKFVSKSSRLLEGSLSLQAGLWVTVLLSRLGPRLDFIPCGKSKWFCIVVISVSTEILKHWFFSDWPLKDLPHHLSEILFPHL